MSLLTGRELEFLASLRLSWKRLYWNELARLLNENDDRCDARHEADAIAPAIRTLEEPHGELGGRILAFDLKARQREAPRPWSIATR